MSRLACLCALLLCSTARAQPAPADAPAPSTPAAAPAPEDAAADVHVKQGEALYNDANFSGALAEFQEAYKLHAQPFLLNDIGLAQRGLFRYPEAIASLQQFLDASPTLAPDLRARTEQIIREIQALLADVTLETTPLDATIVIDGRPASTPAPGKTFAIAAGAHTIDVTADGFEPLKKEIMVSAGVPLALKLVLKAIPKTGKVYIASPIAHARVAIDGHDAGLAPVEVELAAGGHSVEVSAPKYATRHDEVLVTAGQPRDLNVSLELNVQPKSWYQKWYVVTSIALVVVGVGGGLAINFGTHQGPVQGSLGVGMAQ